MPERNYGVSIEGRTFPDTVTVWLDDGERHFDSRVYVSKDLYESVNGACEYWQANCGRLRALLADAMEALQSAEEELGRDVMASDYTLLRIRMVRLGTEEVE